MKPIALSPPSASTLAELSVLERAVLQHCDGRHTVDQIAEVAGRSLEQQIEPWQVFTTLDSLSDQGLIAPLAGPPSSAPRRALAAFGAAAATAAVLALGTVPAHASPDDQEDDYKTENLELDDDDMEENDQEDDKEDSSDKASTDDDKKKAKSKDGTPVRDAQQKAREADRTKRKVERKSDIKRQQEQAKKKATRRPF